MTKSEKISIYSAIFFSLILLIGMVHVMTADYTSVRYFDAKVQITGEYSSRYNYRERKTISIIDQSSGEEISVKKPPGCRSQAINKVTDVHLREEIYHYFYFIESKKYFYITGGLCLK